MAWLTQKFQFWTFFKRKGQLFITSGVHFSRTSLFVLWSTQEFQKTLQRTIKRSVHSLISSRVWTVWTDKKAAKISPSLSKLHVTLVTQVETSQCSFYKFCSFESIALIGTKNQWTMIWFLHTWNRVIIFCTQVVAHRQIIPKFCFAFLPWGLERLLSHDS